MEGVDLMSLVLGALAVVVPYVATKAWKLLKTLVESTETKLDDQALAAFVEAVKEAESKKPVEKE